MGKRKHFICLFLILMVCVSGTLKATEKSDDSLTNAIEMTNDTTLVQEESSKETRKKEVNTVKTRGKTTSIKMIVGGQSSDGVAKQVILPVKE